MYFEFLNTNIHIVCKPLETTHQPPMYIKYLSLMYLPLITKKRNYVPPKPVNLRTLT